MEQDRQSRRKADDIMDKVGGLKDNGVRFEQNHSTD